MHTTACCSTLHVPCQISSIVSGSLRAEYVHQTIVRDTATVRDRKSSDSEQVYRTFNDRQGNDQVCSARELFSAARQGTFPETSRQTPQGPGSMLGLDLRHFGTKTGKRFAHERLCNRQAFGRYIQAIQIDYARISIGHLIRRVSYSFARSVSPRLGGRFRRRVVT
jgi:hypothetical protein